MDPAAGRAIFCRDKPGRLMVPVLPLFLLLFVLVPLLELVLLIEVGGRIGALATVGLCLLTALLGGLLVRSQGRRVLDAIRTALDRGRLPVPEVFHGACILLAGALLLTPGFLTDTLGFLLLIPPLRWQLYHALARRLAPPEPQAGEGARVIQVQWRRVEEYDREPPPGKGWGPP